MNINEAFDKMNSGDFLTRDEIRPLAIGIVAGGLAAARFDDPHDEFRPYILTKNDISADDWVSVYERGQDEPSFSEGGWNESSSIQGAIDEPRSLEGGQFGVRHRSGFLSFAKALARK